MIRLLGAIFFVAICLATSDCQAQLGRGFFFRQFQSSNHVQPFAATQRTPIEWGRYSTYRNPTISRILDGPMTGKYRNPAEVNSRYIGGFHQNYFRDIGIPPGDVGIRGNALYWDTR